MTDIRLEPMIIEAAMNEAVERIAEVLTPKELAACIEHARRVVAARKNSN